MKDQKKCRVDEAMTMSRPPPTPFMIIGSYLKLLSAWKNAEPERLGYQIEFSGHALLVPD